MDRKPKIGILGGGAGGFFSGLEIAKDRRFHVTIWEKSSNFLSKLRISGGGRCNVTHNLFDTDKFATNYPRGNRELKFALQRFGSRDVIQWFEEKGIAIVPEKDGRMFPASGRSETIIDCFLDLAKERNLELKTNMQTIGIRPLDSGKFAIQYQNQDSQEEEIYDKIIIASGSSRQVWKWLESMGHRIQQPVPSIFTFKIQDPRLDQLSGVSFSEATATLPEFKIFSSGPLLITHWGLSGPAILRLSAWSARNLFESNYQARLKINFLNRKLEDIREELIQYKKEFPNKKTSHLPDSINLPKRYWENLIQILNLSSSMKWGDLNSSKIQSIAEELGSAEFFIQGKGEFKEEFVTAGGVNRKDVNFQTMESRVVPGLYFSGEVLDVDGITGGFNFQNAWTTGWIAADSIRKSFAFF